MMVGNVTKTLVHEGFGGKKLIVDCGEEPPCKYIVKCEKIGQSVNEFVAQTLLSAIGYSVPKARIISLESGDNARHGISCFGGVEYIAGAHNLAHNASMIRSNETKRLLYELILIKFILNDADDTIQIMNDDSLGIFLVDLGETLISEIYLGSIIAQTMSCALWKFIIESIEQQYSIQNIDNHIEDGIIACQKYTGDESEENKEQIRIAVNNVLEKLGMSDLRKMKTCFQELKTAYGSDLAELYQELIIKLRKSIRQKLNY